MQTTQTQSGLSAVKERVYSLEKHELRTWIYDNFNDNITVFVKNNDFHIT